MKDTLRRGDALRIHAEWVASVHIPVKHGEIAAGDINPNTMSFPEQLARGAQIDQILEDYSGRYHFRRKHRFAVPGADYSIHHID